MTHHQSPSLDWSNLPGLLIGKITNYLVEVDNFSWGSTRLSLNKHWHQSIICFSQPKLKLKLNPENLEKIKKFDCGYFFPNSQN